MINFDFEKSMNEALKNLDLRDKRIQAAIRSTNIRIVQWMNTQVKKIFSTETKLSGKKLQDNKRLFKEISKDRKKFSKIWVGLNPLKAHWVGGKKLKKGVKAAGTLYPNAWWDEERQIFFIRKPSGKLDVLKVPISPNIEGRMKRLKPQAEKQFYKILQNQLDFRLSK